MTTGIESWKSIASLGRLQEAVLASLCRLGKFGATTGGASTRQVMDDVNHHLFTSIEWKVIYATLCRMDKLGYVSRTVQPSGKKGARSKVKYFVTDGGFVVAREMRTFHLRMHGRFDDRRI